MGDQTARLRAALPVVLCIVAAAVFRLPGIGSRSLWGDEAYSLAMVDQGAGRILTASLLGGVDVHPPLYYLLLKGWLAVFGNGDMAARSLSLVFGCLAVVGICLLGRQLLGRSAGLAAGLIAAISPCFVQSGGEVRMYALMGAAAAFAHLGFARLAGIGNGEGKRWADSLWLVSCLVLVYSHHLGWLAPAAHWVWILWRRRRLPDGLLDRFFRLQALMLLLAAPAAAGLLRQAITRVTMFDTPLALAKKLAGVYLHFSMGYHFANFGRQAARAILGDPLSLALLAAGALGAGYVLLRALKGREGEVRDGVELAAVMLLTPVVLGAVFFQLNLGARYLTVAAPGFALLAAWGLVRGGRGRLFWPAVLLLVAANVVSLATAWRLPVDVVHREDWRALTAHLDAEARPGEFVGCDNILALRYYIGGDGLVLGNSKALGAHPERYAALGGRSAWVQKGVDGSTPPAQIARLEETLMTGWRIDDCQPFGRDLLLYRLIDLEETPDG